MDEKEISIVPLENGEPAEAKPVKELALRTPEQLALKVANVLELIAARLRLETPHPSTARRVRGARTVPRDFVVSMIAAAERRPPLPQLSRFDSSRARSVLEAADGYRVIAERTALFLARLNYTVEAQWATVVADAMHNFTIACIIAENPNNPELAAEVENLRRKLGRGGSRKKKKDAR